jgi:cytosine/adenosine deaminase-related metal-dependent hydrolase
MHAAEKVTANLVPRSPIHVNLIMEAICSSETSVLTRAAQRNVSEDVILHSHCHENLKFNIALTGWTLKRRCNVSPVKYELGIFIPKDDILHSHRRENLKSCIALTGWTL